MTPLHELLHERPLPPVDGDKGDRGTLVLVAGAATCPGAAILSATAALRAGAGRVQLVSDPACAASLGVALPEAYVTGWDLAGPPPDAVVRCATAADAVVIGPGLDGLAAAAACTLAPYLGAGTPLLLDARAIVAAAELRDHPPLVVPNLAEAERLADALGVDDADPTAIALALGAPVAVRGEETVVTDGARTYSSTGDPGLGTAGSGDVLVGLLGGFLARGIEPLTAVGWAVAVHAEAGALLGRGRNNPGYLARELVDAAPAAVDGLLHRRCCR